MICPITIPDCGPLGNIVVYVSYRFVKGRKATQFQPAESNTATIYWIKLGSEQGQEIEIDDDYIEEEIIPACVADYLEFDQAA